MDMHNNRNGGRYFVLPTRAEGDDTCLPCVIGEWAPCEACTPEYHSAYRALCDAYRRLTEIPVETHEPELRIE